MANVRVALRVRPLNSKEAAQHRASGTSNSVVFGPEGHSVYLRSPWVGGGDAGPDALQQIGLRQFHFDYCYWSTDVDPPPPPPPPLHASHASQQTVFEDIGTQVLDALFTGYNACVLAYGQSGTGKTYTMIGNELEPGLTPRLCTAIFDRISSHSDEDPANQTSYRVHVSFMEIYNEKVRDLLESTNGARRLRVREHPKFGPYVQELSRHAVHDAGHCLDLLNAGMKRRTSAPNAHQKHSSRSHAVFTIYLATANISDHLPRETSAKVHLVDLAGSERASHELSRPRLKEGATINRSLATLGNVINALAERSSLLTNGSLSHSATMMGLRASTSTCSLSLVTVGADDRRSAQNTPVGSPRRRRASTFVPYRNSVLTWLLKDSLGGNSRTFVVATVSPAAGAYRETLSTLRFAQRAQHIVNAPVVNEEAGPKLIRHLEQEVLRLRAILAASAVAPTASAATLPQMVSTGETRTHQLAQDWLCKWRAQSADCHADTRAKVSPVCVDAAVQTSLPWFDNQLLTTTRHADDDNLADLFPVKEVSNEFRNLDDDDDSAELVLHLRALDKGAASNSEAEWSPDSLDGSYRRDGDVDADSLDGDGRKCDSKWQRLERSPTPPRRHHRRLHARAKAAVKGTDRIPKQAVDAEVVLDSVHSPSVATATAALDRSIVQGKQLAIKLTSLVDRLSIVNQPPDQRLCQKRLSWHHRSPVHGHHFHCVHDCNHQHHHNHQHQYQPHDHHSPLAIEDATKSYGSLWQFRRQLLFHRRQLVARSASADLRQRLAFLRDGHIDVLPAEHWV